MSGQTDWSKVDADRGLLSTPRLRVNHAVDDEVKLVTYDFDDPQRFPEAPPEIELTHLTDLQFGHKGFQLDRFLAHREWLLAQPNRFVLLGGDLIDAATILSKGSPYENTSEPIDQVDGLCELLEPLAARGRLLGYVGGNHERRTSKTFGDCGRLIARNLKVPYSRGVQYIDITYAEHKPFKVSIWHGSGAARTMGAKAQMLHRFMGQADSHVYAIGHLHSALLLFDWRQQRVNGQIKFQKIAGLMSSSFLGYFNSYAETAALPPSESLMGRVILEPNGRWEITMK